MRSIVVRLLGSALALVPGVAGTYREAQGALATIAALAIAVIAIERQLESRKG